MSNPFLRALAGPQLEDLYRNALHRWLDNHPGTPRLAWYPSAGEDCRDLLYLSDYYRRSKPARHSEPPAPDIFLHTDYLAGSYFDPFQAFKRPALHEIFGDNLFVKSQETLPSLELEFHPDLVSCDPSPMLGTVTFASLRVESRIMGVWEMGFIYAAVENCAMADFMLKHQARVSHIVQMCFGHGLGGGRIPPGFLTRLVTPFQTEVFVTDNHFAVDSDQPVPHFRSINQHPPVDLQTWKVARARESIPWEGYDPAQFLIRPANLNQPYQP
jgi:hypothetical protein